jgi:multidrug efflux pump subunit AcrB
VDSFAKFALSHARFTWLLIIAIIAAGAAVYATQPRQEDPEITIRNAQVITRFPGLSPERIEKLITRPIEKKIKEIPQISDIRSVSMSGLSIVTPEVDERYADMAPIWRQLRDKMEELRPQLPDGVNGPVVNDDYGRLAVVTLALTGADFSMAELNAQAEDLQDALGALPDVARVELYGVQSERIWLTFNPHFLAQFGLTTASVVDALRRQNVILPGGTVNAAGQRIVIEPSGDLRSLDDIRNLAIATNEGSVVYLQDLATIERSYVDPAESPAFYNGEPAIVLGISMVSGANVVALGREITRRLGELRTQLPLGMQLDVVIFQPDLVQASVKNASDNLLQTIAVVLVVVMVFLGLRTGLIVGAMIPLTIMLTLIGMSVGAIELHRISIAAIIVALGLLVDNGIVIAEDIKKRLDDGAERLDAALAAPRQLAFPLLTSSLTTIFAFLPLVLITDGTGEFLRSLGQVLALALLASWIIAITVVPAFCYWFLAGAANAAPRQQPAYTALPYRAYRSLLGVFLRFRFLFVIGVVGLLALSFIVFGGVKQRSLGPSERNQFTVYLDLPAASDISQTTDAALRLSRFLADRAANPEVTDTLAYVGSGGPRFFLALSPNDPQPNKAFLVVNTQRNDQIGAVMQRVEEFIAREIPEGNGRADILFLGPAALGTVELRVSGPEIAGLQALAAQLEGAFQSVPGTRAIRSDWEDPVFKIRVEVDQERARRAEVTSEDIARALSAHFDGERVTDFREDEEVIPVMIRAEEGSRDELDRMRSVSVYSTAQGMAVPLIQIADFGGEVEPSRIRRNNQQRAVTVAGKHPGMTAVELYAAMQGALDAIDIPPGYAIELEGEIQGAQESNAKLLEFAPHALFLILAVLVLQFNSYRRVAIILLTIPLVFVGASFGMRIFGAYFDFTAMLGLFSLAGIIINNGIVMIDRIDQGRKEGLTVDEAVTDAAMARSRPIVMTTITTVAGLVPLALLGGEFWFGMAIVIMCGLAVATVLTLGVVPVLYSLMFQLRGKSTEQVVPG